MSRQSKVWADAFKMRRERDRHQRRRDGIPEASANEIEEAIAKQRGAQLQRTLDLSRITVEVVRETRLAPLKRYRVVLNGVPDPVALSRDAADKRADALREALGVGPDTSEPRDPRWDPRPGDVIRDPESGHTSTVKRRGGLGEDVVWYRYSPDDEDAFAYIDEWRGLWIGGEEVTPCQ